MENQFAVYKMSFDCGRQGILTSVFVAKKSHVRYLIENKIEVYFGEVLGKHSEIYGPIDETGLKLITEDQKVIDLIVDHDLQTGPNPLDQTFINWEHGQEDENFSELLIGEAIRKILKEED